MVMSELTGGGVDGLGLLVFLMCSTYGRNIDPDQQGDKGADSHLKLLPLSILNMYKVVEHIDMLFIGISISLMQLYPPLLGSDFGVHWVTCRVKTMSLCHV